MAPLGAARALITSGADLGKLELIQTQTVSSVSSVDFTSIKGSEYNVHFLTYSNVTVDAGNNQIGIRFKESGTLETASVYQWAMERVEGSSFSDQQSTGFSRLPLAWYALGTNTGANANGYCYFYNLNDSAKYSFITNHSSGWYYGSNIGMQFGSGALPQASTVDGIVIANFSTPTDISGIFSLYGIKED